VAIANLSRAIEFIKALRGKGCRFALDDFGSSLSSFSHLKNMQVDYLKIDGAFVRDMEDDPTDAAMVEAINQLGHVMGLETIAKSVESDAILKRLRELGVDYAQGYAIESPKPLHDMIITDSSP
jgi:EAL domain-containing protein (putative c-di-GMP-specific phosphodiesterase class I)